MLQLDGVSRHFGGLPALDGVSFTIAPGKVTALIGPNGAGKSTLINCITGVDHPTSGAVRFQQRDITGLAAHQVSRLGISRTFQNLRLFPRLSVLDNVLCGLTGEGGRSMFMAMLRLPYLRHRERRLWLRAMEALDRFQLSDKALWPAAILAYGDKKRVELARATVSQPSLLLLDEPVAGLNG
jgi:ABC-type branched-subunit amino acid transport system ATPase component